jgi:DinB superfamily
MVTGPSLQQQMNQKVEEIKQAVSGIDEEKANRSPGEGEWCAKEILWHLTGPEHALSTFEMERFLKEETPELGVTPGQTPYNDDRSKVPLNQLVSRVENQYSEVGNFLAGLNDDQLNRKAHIPFLKETPLGEYPTLGQWAIGLIQFHLNDHVQQLQNLSK